MWAIETGQVRYKGKRIYCGSVRVKPGDWLVMDPEGSIFPCSDSVFQERYVKARDDYYGFL